MKGGAVITFSLMQYLDSISDAWQYFGLNGSIPPLYSKYSNFKKDANL